MEFSYSDYPESEWPALTAKLVEAHPLKGKIVDVVLNSWNDIFNSRIGSYLIGKDIFPSPQIISFFLHELVAHNLALQFPGKYRVGVSKDEKDIHCLTDNKLGVEIKASSNPTQIFANRSYAQPSSGAEVKSKNGYYLAVNFEKLTPQNPHPKILLIRFGYLEHTDWIAQKSSTGQQARLSPIAYSSKLVTLYRNDNK